LEERVIDVQNSHSSRSGDTFRFLSVNRCQVDTANDYPMYVARLGPRMNV